MKKINVILSCLMLVFVVVIGFLFWSKTSILVDEKLLLFDEGIQVNFPNPNEFISSPLRIEGIVNGNGWTGFEGQVGTVRLLDSDGNQLSLGILTAITEWTTLPTSFETELSFTPGIGFGTLVFHNENASGELLRNKVFTLPIRFK